MQLDHRRPCHSNIATPIASGLVSEDAVGAKFLLLVVETRRASVVPVPLMVAVVDETKDEEDEEDEGLGHKLLYTNCSGWPLQALAAPASYVPFE